MQRGTFSSDGWSNVLPCLALPLSLSFHLPSHRSDEAVSVVTVNRLPCRGCYLLATRFGSVTLPRDSIRSTIWHSHAGFAKLCETARALEALLRRLPFICRPDELTPTAEQGPER